MTAKTWTKENLDNLLCLIKHRDLNDPFASKIRNDIEAQTRTRDEDVWNAVLRSGFTELGDALIGVPHLMSLIHHIYGAQPLDVTTLEWANAQNKLAIESIDPTSPDDVLIKAAELGIPPSAIIVNDEFQSGGEYLSNMASVDVIAAYLNAGIDEGFDPESASRRNDERLAETFLGYGLTAPRDTIVHGVMYVDIKKRAIIPEGIVHIADRAFANLEVSSISLPNTLKTIGRNSFDVFGTRSVTAPSSLEEVGKEAFGRIGTVEIFDSCKLPAIDLFYMRKYSSVEYVIRSSSTGEIKYKIYGYVPSLDDKSLFIAAWGPNASFDMKVLDDLYTRYKSRVKGANSDKLKMAINRLRWPIDLDDKTARKYRTYIKKYAQEAAELLVRHDDIDRFKVLFDCGAISSSNRNALLDIAESREAKRIAEFLNEIAQNAPAGNSKRLTVPQKITAACDALDAGDCSKLADLEKIATKVPMADSVELLERAAANCGKAAIDKLYELFGEFEIESTALYVALYSGNLETTKALLEHGANLDCKLKAIDEKRTPAKTLETRKRRYSHGCLSAKDSSGKKRTDNLADAINLFDGQLTSRTILKTKPGIDPNYTYDGNLIVNDPSNINAVNTLLEARTDQSLNKAIAKRLMHRFISFEGKRDSLCRFDLDSATKLLESGILSADEIASFPWNEAIVSGLDARDIRTPRLDIIKFFKQYAPTDLFSSCWRQRFAKPMDNNKESPRYYDHYIDILLIFLDEPNDNWCSNKLDVLTCLVRTGNLKALDNLASRPGWITKARIQKLLDAASESGQTEIIAWLLEHSK